jgi:Skp family chaperone for outer membrane proteins
MRLLAVLLALGMSAPAAMTYAQTPPPAPSPQAKPAPAPAAPRPQGQTPGAPQQPAPAPLPPVFSGGFKYAYIRFQIVASQSAEGLKATQEITMLQEQRQREITEKDKALQSMTDKLQNEGGILSEASRTRLQNEIDRSQRDIQRMVEDAKLDVQKLTEQLQQNFMVKLNPIIERLAKEKELHMIFNAVESGLVWAAPGMDLTTDVINALDGGKPAAAKPSASAPASPPPPAATPPAALTPAPAAPAGQK